ncbi:hypothetical protein BH09MYX1_BH09MYX1_49030 [soil metagenome]
MCKLDEIVDAILEEGRRVDDVLDELRRRVVVKAYAKSGENETRAADAIGMTRSKYRRVRSGLR